MVGNEVAYFALGAKKTKNCLSSVFHRWQFPPYLYIHVCVCVCVCACLSGL